MQPGLRPLGLSVSSFAAQPCALETVNTVKIAVGIGKRCRIMQRGSRDPIVIFPKSLTLAHLGLV